MVMKKMVEAERHDAQCWFVGQLFVCVLYNNNSNRQGCEGMSKRREQQ